MWIYSKQLEYPVNITKPNPGMAKLLMAQYGGPDSELGAGMRYLTQRFTMPDDRCRATLNDIGTEELAHWEMIGTMIYQCMRGAAAGISNARGCSAIIPCTTTAYFRATRTACRLWHRTFNAPAIRSPISSKILRPSRKRAQHTNIS